MPGLILLKDKNRIKNWADTDPVSSTFFVRWLHTLVRICIIGFREAISNNLSLRSGALTYTIMLSMVPMLAMSTAVVKGLGGGNQLKQTVYAYMDTLEQTSGQKQHPGEQSDTAPVYPPQDERENAGYASHLRSAVDQLFDYVDRTNFTTLGTFGMLGIFLTAILLLNHIETTMNVIWHVEAGRSVLRKVTDYLTLMVLLPIALSVAFAAGTILESQALALHIDRLIPAGWMQNLLFKGIPVFFLTVALYAMYLFFPNTKLKMIPTFIGALLAGVAWFITQNIYISMQIGVARYNAIFGSFATLPLFLIWIYCGWLFVLLGAQVAYAIQNRCHYRISESKDAPALQLSAAFDASAVISEGFRNNTPVTIEEIREQYPEYRRTLLDQITDSLIAAGLIHRVVADGRLMPSLPPSSITPQLIVRAIMGASPVESSGGQASTTAVAGAADAFQENREEHGEKNQAPADPP